jgi:adenylate kinase
MVKERLLQADAQEKGWLLDGYPRSYSQSMALENLGIRPDIFILLDVSAQAQQYQTVGICANYESYFSFSLLGVWYY